MGVDAYRLGSQLDWMSANSLAYVQGKTGILRVDSQARILAWAREKQPKILAWIKSLF